MDLESELREETGKWLLKIKEEMKGVRLKDSSKEGFLKNINAYIQDSEYFLEKNDLIRSFEAVIWAWSLLETGRELGFF